MNTKKIGLEFEKECIPILEYIFDSVEWLSGLNSHSSYDFKCKKNGKYYNIDAKYISTKSMPKLTYSQGGADMVICKINGEIIIYEKDTLLGNVMFSVKPQERTIVNPPFCIKTKNPNKPITQIKKYGNSIVIKLSPEFVKYMGLKINDWVDISDIIKMEKKK